MVELRADARRNLERVLDAATEVFGAEGPEASVAEIAERAGVGHGTVFRRFPTKDDLMLAVIERHVGAVTAIAKEALASDDPGAAFFDFARRAAAQMMSSPGLHKCVVHCGGKPGAAELDALGRKIVSRAQRTGAVRGDVRPEEVGGLIRAALLAGPSEHWRSHLEVVLDGLRA